jgi:hypothetical protein
MKKTIHHLFAGLILLVSPVVAQSINVTPTGVDIGNTTPGTVGTLLQQTGQTTSVYTQDGTTSTLRLTILPNGNVGIGTTTPPAEKLSVTGNTVTTGSATVGSLIVGTSTLFTVGSFESGEYAIPGLGNNLTVPHGLGGVPKFSTVSLRCKTAEYGWVVGDEILLSSMHMVSNNTGATTAVNATSFKFAQNGLIYIHGFSPTTLYALTAGNWRLVFRAWR